LLPNIAVLSDRQCEQIREHVRQRGSIMGSFETGLYNENLKPRADLGLADLTGIGNASNAIGTNGNAYYSRIERQHPQTLGQVNLDEVAILSAKLAERVQGLDDCDATGPPCAHASHQSHHSYAPCRKRIETGGSLAIIYLIHRDIPSEGCGRQAVLR
jgi:hypothetical protein